MIPVAITMAGAEMFHLAASAEPIYPPTPTAITPIPKARKAIPRNLGTVKGSRLLSKGTQKFQGPQRYKEDREDCTKTQHYRLPMVGVPMRSYDPSNDRGKALAVPRRCAPSVFRTTSAACPHNPCRGGLLKPPRAMKMGP